MIRRYAIATLSVLALGMITGSYADVVVDGFSYEGIGVGVTISNADIEFGEIILDIESPEGGTLTIEMDTTILAPGSSDGTIIITLDGTPAEPTVEESDSMITITLEIPPGTTEAVVSGVADASIVEARDALADAESELAESEVAEPADAEPEVIEPAVVETTDAESPMAEATMEGVADFVEPGVDASVYVERYRNDEAFATWYNQWYPDQPLYSALGITQMEYQSIVDDLNAAKCPPGTEMAEGVCIRIQTQPEDIAPASPTPTEQPESDVPKVSAAREYEAQGGGMQIGIAAAAGFGAAFGVFLILWLPHRVWRRRRNKHQSKE